MISSVTVPPVIVPPKSVIGPATEVSVTSPEPALIVPTPTPPPMSFNPISALVVEAASVVASILSLLDAVPMVLLAPPVVLSDTVEPLIVPLTCVIAPTELSVTKPPLRPATAILPPEAILTEPPKVLMLPLLLAVKEAADPLPEYPATVNAPPLSETAAFKATAPSA